MEINLLPKTFKNRPNMVTLIRRQKAKPQRGNREGGLTQDNHTERELDKGK